ncbi:helix-turn-helix domain-containing protein [Jeotgalibaca porci]|uniref:helix-turn-helix domain-containing protein n=1 Tax=Jeotgalibaca porci TaxID=1868793 RepID=UPI0035A13A84
MNIGSRLKEGRLKKELTQKEVADRINVSRSTVSSWENERTYPDLESLILLSDLYEQTLDELLREDRKVVEQITSETKKSKKRKYIIIALLLFFIPLTIGLGYKEWRNSKVINIDNVEDVNVSLNGDALNKNSIVTLKIKTDPFYTYTGYFMDTEVDSSILRIELYQKLSLQKSKNDEIIEIPINIIEPERIKEIRIVNLLNSEVKSIYIK